MTTPQPGAAPTVRLIDKDNAESHSANLVQANIERLQALFPDAFTEGRIDFEVLKSLLGAEVDEREEKYGLNWHGKRRARQLALTPSTGTLRPCPEESVDWDTTQNLMIEGDNLEVLKLLQKSYAGKVKLIYIDPPYNTGKDFVYPDNFQDSIKNYLELTGQVEGGQKISSHTDASGRFHTDWLNMIYPRLRLARGILHEDGAVFISIDDGEVNNLRSILDEIFGPENFVAQFIWEKRTTRENRRVFSFNHEYVLCVAKNKETFEQSRNLLPTTEEVRARYANPDGDPRGPWQSVSLNAQAGHATKDQFYTYTTPGGRTLDPPPGRCWTVSRDRLDQLARENRVWFGESGNNVPRTKLFLSEARDGLTPHTLWTADEVGTNDSAKKALIELFEGKEVFDTPKPTALIRRMIEITTNSSDIVLDFFAGAGPTAQAVFEANAADNGDRRFVLVQLPEPVDVPGFSTISAIARERIRRSATVARERNALFAGDTGFKAFRLDASNIRAWSPNPADLQTTVEEHTEHLLPNRSEQDVLYELLLKLGLDLAVPIETRQIAGRTVHNIGAGALMVCLSDGIDRDVAEPLALGIAQWQKAQAEALQAGGDDNNKPAGTKLVFKDSAFTDDVAKTNLAAILSQHGLDDVRSI